MPNLINKCIAEVTRFEPRANHGDLIWEFYLNHKNRWQYIHIQQYDGVYYFLGSDWDRFSTQNFEKIPEEAEDFFKSLPNMLRKVYRDVKNDSIAYHRKLNQSVSVHLRQGIIARHFVNQLIPEIRRFDQELSPAEMSLMIRILQGHREVLVDKMTAQKYFDYCKVAYLANGRASHSEMNLKASGFKLYDRWADPRDGGLKKINRKSPRAFENWYHGKEWSGSHPFEIYRGGNSTHIDLYVSQDEKTKKWKVTLNAFSSSRLVETCRIALAFYKAGLRFELTDSESYLLRLKSEDWIGILPRNESLKYGWHDFPKEWHVADCIHFSWFKPEDKRSIRPLKTIKGLVSWFPLPMVRISSKHSTHHSLTVS